jgi:LysM repeat protein
MATVDHKYETYVSNNNATCQKNATETAECVFNCGETDTRDIADSKVDHSFTNYVSNNNATCQKNATETAECEYEITADVASTCSVKGYTSYKCKVCGHSYTDIKELDAANHSGNNHFENAIVPVCNAKGYEGDIICEYDLSHIGTNFNIISESEIEIRTNIEIFVRLTESFPIDIITECVANEPSEGESSLPRLIIYFVQKDDTLWDIAKHYNTTTKRIKDANHIESVTSPGQKLLIPAR